MNSLLPRILPVLLSILILLPAECAGTDFIWLRIFPEDYPEALLEFGEILDYDITGVDSREGTIDVLVPYSEFDCLGSQYELQILKTPDQFKGGLPLSEYHSPQEVYSLLQSYSVNYPSITSLVSIGQSEEGRDIWAIKISDNALVCEDEPRLLFNGQQHAREVMGAEVALDTVDYLCTNYGIHPEVTEWIDAYEIWVVPCVNVDGANYMFTQSSGWRKDRHPPPPGSSCYGIDPNRNCPYRWAGCSGASENPCDPTYQGESPETSYCTVWLLNFTAAQRPVFDISYHSYSELVIYPYGCRPEVTSEHALVAEIGQRIAGLIERDDGGMGYEPGTCWDILYSAPGGDIDTMFAYWGTYAYVIELNSDDQGFQPEYSEWRDDTCMRLRPAWQYLLRRMSGPAIKGRIRDGCTDLPVMATVSIQEIPVLESELPRTTDSFGSFYRLTPSGAYHLNISAAGYRSVVIPVSTQDSPAEINVDLVPDGSFGLYVGGCDILDTEGDNDGILDPGETASIEIQLTSIGATTNVTATISSQSPYVSILDATAEFGHIADGATAASLPPHFRMLISEECPDDHTIRFDLQMQADQDLCADEGSILQQVSYRVYVCPLYQQNLDSDPGYQIINDDYWGGDDGWEFGQPDEGISGGHTGFFCYGTNLDGDYEDYADYQLISAPFDCRHVIGTKLKFWRFLQNETNYDTASVDISTDGSMWSTIWSGYSMDQTWIEQTFDISASADRQPVVYVRWHLISDSNRSELGYYVDDISICGYTFAGATPTPGPPTFTPLPTSTYSPTRTPTQALPTATRTPTATITSTGTIPRTSTPTSMPGLPTHTPPPTYTTVPTGTQTPDWTAPPSPTSTPTKLQSTSTPSPTAPPQEPTYTSPPPNTSTPSPSTTETPAPEGFSAGLILSDDIFEAGEIFALSIEIRNETGEHLTLQQYLILDVHGTYFFHPDWNDDAVFVERRLAPDYHEFEEILRFPWPAVSGSGSGIRFYLGYLHSGTWDLAGEIDTAEFGWQ